MIDEITKERGREDENESMNAQIRDTKSCRGRNSCCCLNHSFLLLLLVLVLRLTSLTAYPLLLLFGSDRSSSLSLPPLLLSAQHAVPIHCERLRRRRRLSGLLPTLFQFTRERGRAGGRALHASQRRRSGGPPPISPLGRERVSGAQAARSRSLADARSLALAKRREGGPTYLPTFLPCYAHSILPMASKRERSPLSFRPSPTVFFESILLERNSVMSVGSGWEDNFDMCIDV